MKEQIKNIFKCVLFLLILLCSLTAINKVLVPKYILKNSTWPTTSSYRQFYKMEPNSIDVLFLGSSVCVTMTMEFEAIILGANSKAYF